MESIRFTTGAQRDLDELWFKIARVRSVTAADRIVRGVGQACLQLVDFPELGRSRPDISPEARSIRFERRIVVYRLLQPGVLVVRVVDGRRDLTSLDCDER